MIELMEHQKKALKIAQEKDRYGFFFDTGTGKTLIGIEIIKQKNVKTLVICPLSIIQGAWIGDIQKFEPGLLEKTINIWQLHQDKKKKGGEDKWEAGLKNCQIGLINYELFRLIGDELNKYNFQMILLDESSKIKNVKAQITKKIIDYCDNIKYAYLFSGTPASNTEADYFCQIRAMSKDVFGRNFYAFRNKYFIATTKVYNPRTVISLIRNGVAIPEDELKNKINAKTLAISYKRVNYRNTYYLIKNAQSGAIEGYPEYYLADHMKPLFFEKLKSVSMCVKKEDVLDLPERTFNPRSVILSAEERKIYNKMKKELLVELRNVTYAAKSQIAKIMKLREITAGILINKNQSEIIGNSKIRELQSLIEEIGEAHQILIWGQFKKEIDEIAKSLCHKYSIAKIYGDTARSERGEIIENFKNNNIRLLVAHPKTLGIGLTFVNCSYMIYNSLSYSYGEYYQSTDRIYRKGQREKCTYFFLLGQDTIDSYIYEALQNKSDMGEKILKYLQK